MRGARGPTRRSAARGVIAQEQQYNGAEATYTRPKAVSVAIASGVTAEATELRLALNGQQASFSMPFSFTARHRCTKRCPTMVMPSPWVLALWFACDFDSTSTGGSFSSGTDYCARFGSASQPTTFVSDGELHCHAPSEASASSVDLRLSLDGQQYGPPPDFEFLEAPQVDSIKPSSGVFAGGAIVDVAGTGFANRSLLACRFGGPIVDVSGEQFSNTAVPGTFFSASMVR